MYEFDDIDSSVNGETRMFRRYEYVCILRPVDGSVNTGKDRVFRERARVRV